MAGGTGTCEQSPRLCRRSVSVLGRRHGVVGDESTAPGRVDPSGSPGPSSKALARQGLVSERRPSVCPRGGVPTGACLHRENGVLSGPRTSRIVRNDAPVTTR